MSSITPPLLPVAHPRPKGDGTPTFLAPLAKSVLVVCIVSAVCWAGGAVLAALLAQSAWLKDLLDGADLSWMPSSLRWFGRHAVAVNVGMLVLSLVGAAACWGLLRRNRWALWTFIMLLVVTALLNFVGAWVIDEVFRQLIVHLPPHADADAGQLRRDLQMQRVIYTGLTVLTALAFAALHAWLVARVLRPDVRRWFAAKAP
jgi:cytochrome bd-type quinol oxidase subunit 1